MAIVRGLLRGKGMVERAVQPRRMQDIEQPLVAPLLIEKIVDGDQHSGEDMDIAARSVKPPPTRNRSRPRPQLRRACFTRNRS